MKCIFALALFWLPVCAVAKTLAVVSQSPLEAPASHGRAKLEAAFKAKGWSISNDSGDARIEIRTGCKLNAEGFAITSGAQNTFIVCAPDSRGLMYALLEMAERASWTGDPWANQKPISESPFLQDRAVSMYTMQRAWFESRLYDTKQWERYFDLLAASRINRFVVIFGYENGGFMAPLYPYFFNVPAFPQVEMVGLTGEQQQRNTEAFHSLIKAAHDRGIQITAGIWDHIYRGGVQGGGIEGASEKAGKRTPGLVWGLDADNLAPYTKAALRQFLQVFPDIDSIQFRMHDESGLKPSEMAAFWHEVFADLKQARSEMPVELRAKALPDSIIMDALRQKLNVRVSTKYWMEQMGMPFHPTHINKQNQSERRHSYADLLHYPKFYEVQWRLWNGGTTRLLLWGDPEYVRRTVRSARLYDGHGFEVNEMLATKMLGEPHDAAPVEILNSKYRYYDYEFERYWHFYQLWGRLAYNPDTPSEVWDHEFTQRFGAAAAPDLESALHIASNILPRIVAASYPYNFFPTTRGWAEMMRLGDLPKYYTEHTTDTEQFQSALPRARDLLSDTARGARTPEQTSEWFAATAASVLSKVAAAGKAAGKSPSKEFISTATDLRILAHLAEYHAQRLQAAVQYALWKETRNPAALDQAIGFEKRGLAAWQRIVESAGDVYSPSLPFGYRGGFPRHWKQELERVRAGVAQLEQERASANQGTRAKPLPVPTKSSDHEPPEVTINPAEPTAQGMPVTVTAKATDPSGIQIMRLHYRHMAQVEDYTVTDMKPDANGLYTGVIPPDFIDPHWSLMFFVEAVDKAGNGRLYPDLEKDKPYVIVPVVP